MVIVDDSVQLKKEASQRESESKKDQEGHKKGNGPISQMDP